MNEVCDRGTVAPWTKEGEAAKVMTNLCNNPKGKRSIAIPLRCIQKGNRNCSFGLAESLPSLPAWVLFTGFSVNTLKKSEKRKIPGLTLETFFHYYCISIFCLLRHWNYPKRTKWKSQLLLGLVGVFIRIFILSKLWFKPPILIVNYSKFHWIKIFKLVSQLIIWLLLRSFN